MKRYYRFVVGAVCLIASLSSLPVAAYEAKYYRDEHYNLRAWYYNRIEAQESNDLAMIMCPKYNDIGFVDKNILADQYTDVKDAYVGELVVPETIKTMSKEMPVVALDKAAFYMSTNITGVTLHNGIEYIGEGAFYGCSKLTHVNIPDGITTIEGGTFWACEKLSQLEMPNSIIEIGRQAFCGCKKLHSIVVPKNVKSIDEQAFYLSGIHEVEIKGNWPTLGSKSLWSAQRIIYRGEPPADSSTMTAAIQASCILYVDPLKGWGPIPGTLNGIPLHDIRGIEDGFIVSFDAVGGVVSEQERHVKDGDCLGNLPKPAREGYVFLGWFASATGNDEKVSESTIVSGDIRLYAHWIEAVTYTVTFNTGSLHIGNIESYREYVIGSSLGLLPQPDYYKFGGWLTSLDCGRWADSSIIVTNNMTLYAYWKEDVKYWVGFDAGLGGSVSPDSKQYASGSRLTELPTPTRVNHTFAGWYTSNGARVDDRCVVTKRTTLYARWTEDSPPQTIVFTVSFNANGGSVSPLTKQCSSGSSIGTLPVPRRSGYDFIGWFTAPSGGYQVSTGTVVTKNETWYAHWTQNVTYFTVCFDANGGTVYPSTKQCASGSCIDTLPVPTRNGYDFVGWFTAPSGGIQVSVGTVITKNETWYAQWTENVTTPTSCTVWFIANGGTVSPETKQCPKGQSIGLLPIPTRNGYDFDGWFTDFSEKVSDNAIIYADTTLWARWSKQQDDDPPSTTSYTVTFDAHGGKFADGQEPHDVRKIQYSEGNSIGDPPAVVQVGCDLIGWSYSKGFDYETSWMVPDNSYITTKTKVTKNLRVYAQWREVTYYVMFDANGGSCPTDGKWVKKDFAVGELPIPQRTGYEFVGWKDRDDWLSATSIIVEPKWCYAQWKKLPVVTYGSYVPGESVSLAMPEYIGYTAKGLPSGLKFDKAKGVVSGAPTKPTGDVGAMVTFSKKGAESLEALFIVAEIPTLNVTLDGDTEKCKVTGVNKSYLVGKKVSLSASSPKGTAFVGWYKNGEPWPSASECTKTKLSYVMTKESLNLTARFEKEKMSLACPGLANTEFTAGVAADVAGIPLEITTQSGVKSVKATKLPTGMKLVQDKTSKTWSITGAPTKAGTYNVVLSVTAVSGAVQSITIPVTVEALPSWLVGTYTGMVGRGVGENWMAYGTLSLTVAATGKISAKVVVPSGSYSFTATRWDENLDDAFAVQMKTKKGETLSLIVDGALPWYEARISDAESGNMFSIPNVEPFRVVAWRNEFGKDGEIAKDPTASDFILKIIAQKNVALRVTGSKSEGYDLSLLSSNDRTADLKLAFDAKGNVKYSGKVDGVSVSGKTVLRIDGSDYYTILDLVVPIKKAEVMYFAFGFERDEFHNPEYDFEIMRMDYR